MTIWIDAQLSPALAGFFEREFHIPAFAVRDLGLREAKDEEIFAAARDASTAIAIVTKSEDFANLLERYGPPPQIIWITCGNTSNAYLRQLFRNVIPVTLQMLETGEPLIEIF